MPAFAIGVVLIGLATIAAMQYLEVVVAQMRHWIPQGGANLDAWKRGPPRLLPGPTMTECRHALTMVCFCSAIGVVAPPGGSSSSAVGRSESKDLLATCSSCR